MNRKDYCRYLLSIKGQRLSILSYLGKQWIILKLVIGLIAALAIFKGDIYGPFGIFLLGYLVGSVVVELRNVLIAIRRWEHQQALLDWDLVQTTATAGENKCA